MKTIKINYLKLLGFASLGSCALVAKRLNRAGKLPDMEDDA